MSACADDRLPPFPRVLAVCAHPDDESFGLGAVLSTFAEAGARLDVLCLTRGEASTLHGIDGSLVTVRAAELAAAGQVLGVSTVELLDHPDGALATQPFDELAGDVARVAGALDPSVLLVFDHGGITGHPDHQRATDAAVAVAPSLAVPVLAWALPADVADRLNRELATSFVGRTSEELDLAITVDRSRQLAAIRAHRSQSIDNPVLWRRLELMGPTEWLRYLI